MEEITLTMREQKRIDIINLVTRGKLTMKQAAAILDVSERQAYRIKSNIEKKGVKGVIHGNRGKSRSWKMTDDIERKIISLRKEKYAGFNDTHFTEKLVEVEGISVSREKVRRVLRASGVATPRKKRPPKYRSRRPRRECSGIMVQVDGSSHDWLEGRGPAMCLIGGIDDATGKVAGGEFRLSETSDGYFSMFESMFRKHGIPQTVYCDRTSILYPNREPTLEEQLAGKPALTQVGRGLYELGVSLIFAKSPQGKGRIERLWGTFQDRLISEFRIAGAKNMAEAQALLDRYVIEYNRKFAKPAAKTQSAWREVPPDVDLRRVLCWKHRRTVAKDNTISFGGRVFQLPRVKPHYSLSGRKVDVLTLRDGRMEIYYGGTLVGLFPAMIDLNMLEAA